MSGSAILQTDYQPGIVCLSISNPVHRNALNDSLIEQLTTALRKLGNEPSCHLILIRGDKGTFSAGRELNDLRKLQDSTLDDITAVYERLHELSRAFHECPTPIMAVVERFAFGAGAAIVSWCDMAIIEASAFMCYPELQHGIVPSPSLMALLRSVPEKLAMELLLTGRRVYGPEAARIGLATRSVASEDLDGAINQIAGGVGSCSLPAVRRLKRFKLAAEAMSSRDAMAEAVHSISAGLLDAETRRRIASFLD